MSSAMRGCSRAPSAVSERASPRCAIARPACEQSLTGVRAPIPLMKADEIDCGKGKSLAYVLGLLARAIEGGEFEKRIEALETAAGEQRR